MMSYYKVKLVDFYFIFRELLIGEMLKSIILITEANLGTKEGLKHVWKGF